jgi:hypothetical protein
LYHYVRSHLAGGDVNHGAATSGAPRLSASHVDGWRWDHVRDLNIPAWRKWVNVYSAGNILDVAAYFLASAAGWALHKRTGVDSDATRLRGEPPKVRPLVDGRIMSRLAQCHAIARIAIVAADHIGPVQRYVVTKIGIERAIKARDQVNFVDVDGTNILKRRC